MVKIGYQRSKREWQLIALLTDNYCFDKPMELIKKMRMVMVFLPLLLLKGSKRSLSSVKAPAGYPNKNSNNRNIVSATEDDRKREKAPVFSLPPSHRAPRAFLFFLPSPPTTQRGLYGGERQKANQRQARCIYCNRIAHCWQRRCQFDSRGEDNKRQCLHLVSTVPEYDTNGTLMCTQPFSSIHTGSGAVLVSEYKVETL